MNHSSTFWMVLLVCLSGPGRAGENEGGFAPGEGGSEAHGFWTQASRPEEPAAAGEGDDVPSSDEISLFPDDHVFEPLLAFMKEPQFSVAFRRVQFREGRELRGGGPVLVLRG